VQDTYTIKTLQRGTAAAVNRAASGRLVTITRREKPVAVMLSHARLSALVETMELVANPKAMKALRDARAGRARYTPLDKLPD
jgi:prevent-host-death family protein